MHSAGIAPFWCCLEYITSLTPLYGMFITKYHLCSTEIENIGCVVESAHVSSSEECRCTANSIRGVSLVSLSLARSAQSWRSFHLFSLARHDEDDHYTEMVLRFYPQILDLKTVHVISAPGVVDWIRGCGRGGKES